MTGRGTEGVGATSSRTLDAALPFVQEIKSSSPHINREISGIWRAARQRRSSSFKDPPLLMLDPRRPIHESESATVWPYSNTIAKSAKGRFTSRAAAVIPSPVPKVMNALLQNRWPHISDWPFRGSGILCKPIPPVRVSVKNYVFSAKSKW